MKSAIRHTWLASALATALIFTACGGGGDAHDEKNPRLTPTLIPKPVDPAPENQANIELRVASSTNFDNAYVPIEINPALITPLWELDAGPCFAIALFTADRLTWAENNCGWELDTHIRSANLDTGQTTWRYSFGPAEENRVRSLGLSGGDLNVWSPDRNLVTTLDLQTGKLKGTSTVTAPPVASDGRYDYFLASANGNATAIKLYDKTTSELVYTLNNPDVQAFNSCRAITIVPGGNNDLLAYYNCDRGSIVQHYELASGVMTWHQISARTDWRTGRNFGLPVVANGVVYLLVTESNELLALDQKDGSLLWQWKPDEPNAMVNSDMVVTKNLAIVGGPDEHTSAIDLSTHQSVMSLPGQGALHISATGKLYILDRFAYNDGILLRAFNLN
ncbi:outer membrane protein assembly factor BamB [Silvimonas terrae]|uniref:Outer membrane protein assembly factor BamB n=1 Tax=Silvimonas terrae TaxID=300266 RepID=A0A840RDI0_9NEIS|nr:PQQ-binding-like beta-propeller repeat protein [Silvimonas terrae]MBB5191385.1 outer membrane protein assembly factor BamB [Silvimonas terrae]